MAQVTQLMDLSDEILLEIAAHVPFEAPTWSALSQVNRRFNAVMTTDSLPAKAANIQFPIEDAFVLPLEEGHSKRLAVCKHLSEYISSMAAFFSTNEDVQKLIGIAILFLHTKEIEGRLLPFPTSKNRSLTQYDHHYRTYLIHFSVLRLLPTDVHVMLRYFALKMYERCYASSTVLSLLGFEPQGGDEKRKWLCDAGSFLCLEMSLIMPWFKTLDKELTSLSSAIRNNNFAGYRSHVGCIALSEDGTLPVLKKGKFLPSAMGVMEATANTILHENMDDPERIEYHFWRDAERVFPENLQIEFSEQVKHARELVSQIEAPDGQYVRNMLDNLDLKFLHSVVTQQANQANEMSGVEVREALAKEIAWLIE